MKWSVRAEIIVYLLFAFGSEFALFAILPISHKNFPYFQILPYLAFFAGLFLAYRTARRAYLENIPAGDEKSWICSKCGYDMRATPQKCPECGGIRTGGRPIQFTPEDRWWAAARTFVAMTVLAALAAGAILIHVQVLAVPSTGGH